MKSSFPLRFPPICRAGKARRAEGGCGGNSARRIPRVPFGYFQTDTATLGTSNLLVQDPLVRLYFHPPCACSSGDRALGCGPKGRRFESCQAYRSRLTGRLLRVQRHFVARQQYAQRRPLNFGTISRGEVSERFKVLLSKSSVVTSHRGFESRPLRHRAASTAPVREEGSHSWPSARAWKARIR